MGVELLGLWGLAVYAWIYPRWTEELDGLAMMRIGNVLAGDGIRLDLAGTRRQEIGMLQDLPGRIGDSQADQPRGRLGLGAQAPLRRRRAYEVDGDVPAPASPGVSMADLTMRLIFPSSRAAKLRQ
ncbi:hypothetical protein BJX70DRAFT_355027 [Aspergillus crustosus]